MADNTSGDGKQRILILEGNETRGKTLELVLREIGGYQAIFTSSMITAVQLIRKADFDMILTNTSVEKLHDGVRLAQMVLLRQASQQAPLFIMVTVEKDRELVRASRRAGVVDYIVYPYDPENLIKRIRTAFLQHNRMDQSELKLAIVGTLRKIFELPTIPDTQARVQELLKEPEIEAEDLAEVIELDQALTTKLLQLSNSAEYGQQRRVASVRDAVVILGLKNVGAIVMACSTFEAMGRIKESPRFNRMAFWEHSVGCAAIARVIARKVLVDPEEAFVAGLIHDLGKVVMDGFFPDYFTQALDTADEEKIHILEAEKRHLPVTHEVVGRYLAHRWQLPGPLIAAVGDHHTLALEDSSNSRLVRLVHLADTWCRQLQIGSAGDDVTWSPTPKILSAFGLRGNMLDEWRADIEEEMKPARALLNLID